MGVLPLDTTLSQHSVYSLNAAASLFVLLGPWRVSSSALLKLLRALLCGGANLVAGLSSSQAADSLHCEAAFSKYRRPTEHTFRRDLCISSWVFELSCMQNFTVVLIHRNLHLGAGNQLPIWGTNLWTQRQE